MEECSICLEDLHNGDPIGRPFSCHWHTFHDKCVERITTCPLCRADRGVALIIKTLSRITRRIVVRSLDISIDEFYDIVGERLYGGNPPEFRLQFAGRSFSRDEFMSLRDRGIAIESAIYVVELTRGD
jgi:hypothetical protein